MDCMKFKVNGEEHSVGSDVSSDVMLVDYLRNYLQLRGTKFMCREGGCGACIVTASKTSGAPYVAINSCMVAVTSCHGWSIKTIEGMGNRKDGYHAISTALAEASGTQCGYCSSGWVMSMHGLMESEKDLTMLKVEKGFGSNICRCTGYRPILSAFKQFAKDAPAENRISVKDIENLSICNKGGKCCKTSFDDDEDWCVVRSSDYNEDKMKTIKLKDGKTWYRPRKLSELLSLLEKHSGLYKLIAGNTAKGVYPKDNIPDVLIDISCVEDLKTTTMDQNLIVGAGTTLNDFLSILKTEAEKEYFSYLSKLYDHIDLVAHIPLRNVATIAGNLMIKHENNEFQSDVFLLLETVGAELTIVDCYNRTEVVTMDQFLKTKMNGKVILNVLLPPLTDACKIWTYKLMSRAQSSHALVNAGFFFKLNCSNVVAEARIVYGALSVNFRRAPATESYLIGKTLFTNETLQEALKVLDKEMIVDDLPPAPSVEYRRHIAKALFYKCLLTLCPTRSARYESATTDVRLQRPCSTAKQTYSTDTSKWPLTQPIPKLEAKIQCSGEAQYSEDIPSYHNEVYASFVLSTVARGTITKMDASEALKVPGVLNFYTAKDIPGVNTFTPSDGGFTIANEEVLCEGIVKFHGQPVAIIVAESRHIADTAAKLVKVTYSNVTKPVVDIKVAKEDSSRVSPVFSAEATNPGSDVYKTLTGTNVMRGQYHFTIEPVVCVASPSEEGLKVEMPTQWLDGTQISISRALNIDLNKIDLYVSRVGGSFGLKITRSIQAAVACSLVAHKMNRPCRFIMSLTMAMKTLGKRMPNLNDYEVTINSSGQIQHLNSTLYLDNGHMLNDTITVYTSDVYNNCYDSTKITFQSNDCTTDTAKNTFFRAPGTLEAIANIEILMERISYELSMDPITVRLQNLDTTNYSQMLEALKALEKTAQYTTRKAAVDSFNTQNRWKKRGLRWCFARWPTVGGMYADVNLAVFHADATVAITHGGVEMGQGLNTKIAQTAAHLLKIPLEYVQIKSINTIMAPNSYVSGGSISTESIIAALQVCIEELETRLKPIKDQLTNPTWAELITAAYTADVDLQFHGFCSKLDAKTYNVYGIAQCEVELDVLTGEYDILRVDIMQDVGISISPEIDVGQIEGGFIMGMGYWTVEKLAYDSETGAILTDSSWHYHVLEARDIPRDFRVTFMDNSYSHDRIFGSKAIGEGPTCLAVVVPFALREAMVHARQESGIPTTEWFDIDGPFCLESICLAMKTKTEDFKLS